MRKERLMMNMQGKKVFAACLVALLVGAAQCRAAEIQGSIGLDEADALLPS